ncbi:Mobile element protein [Candidatus Enterovibrio altilux]|uniref:Mobile element protein n=1 Tax=Candidatus Enterovibrio altilux TaxID=1927128 RepID=A0A291B9N0_9GAMM|nr:Mobile element protein [Candidatus Enterovibrio luxaltus]
MSSSTHTAKKRATFGERNHSHNLSVSYERLCGSNQHWEMRYSCHKRSLSETTMFRVKKLLGGTLRLKDHNPQISETYAMIKTLNKLTGLSMPQIKAIV